MISVKSLAGVFALAAFILIVLSVFTLCFFMGSLRQKCIKWSVPGNWSYDWSDSVSNNHSDYDAFDFLQYVNDRGKLTRMMMVKQNDTMVKPSD